MGQQVIRQPDGKLAVFSTVVDGWVLYDAEPTDIIDYFVEQATAEARRQAKRIIEAVLRDEPRDVYFQFARSFEQADALNEHHHGKKFAEMEHD